MTVLAPGGVKIECLPTGDELYVPVVFGAKKLESWDKGNAGIHRLIELKHDGGGDRNIGGAGRWGYVGQLGRRLRPGARHYEEADGEGGDPGCAETTAARAATATRPT